MDHLWIDDPAAAESDWGRESAEIPINALPEMQGCTRAVQCLYDSRLMRDISLGPLGKHGSRQEEPWGKDEKMNHWSKAKSNSSEAEAGKGGPVRGEYGCGATTAALGSGQLREASAFSRGREWLGALLCATSAVITLAALVLVADWVMAPVPDAELAGTEAVETLKPAAGD